MLAALVSGAVFGLGLALSGMLDPARVQGFLDITGAWDPSLAFVLGGAVGVMFLGLRLIARFKR
ncbi:MAG: YeeE/YedE family protein, partial [Shinella sp.]|nr:YeeE/YedE family protein [Shinella sp.]